MSASHKNQTVDKKEKKAKRKLRNRRLAILLVGAVTLTVGAMNWQSIEPHFEKLSIAAMALKPASDLQFNEELPLTVIVQHPTPQSGAVKRHFVAVIHPSSETALSFQVPGRIERRFVETGDRVDKGQVLAQLSKDDFNLERTSAMAEVRAAKRLLSVTTEEEHRTATLQKSGIVSQAQYENAQGQLQEAASRLDQAEARLRIAENASGYTVLKAEVDGIILDEMIEAGQVIAAGETVLRVSPIDTYEAEVAFPENIDLPPIGTKATFRPWAAPDQIIQTHLYEISPMAATITHTFSASFTLTGPQTEGLKYGMTGQLTLIQGDEGEDVMQLPSSAVYDAGDGAGPGVWRVTDAGRLTFVPVVIKNLDGTQVLLEGVLKPEDQIVRVGANQLSEGLLVRTHLGRE